MSKELKDLGGQDDSLSMLVKHLKAVHSGSEWRDPGIPSSQCTNNSLISGHIARICAWGAAATGTYRTCYRFFAACVQACYVLATIVNWVESNLCYESLQNLSLNIIPLIRVQKIEYGNIEEHVMALTPLDLGARTPPRIPSYLSHWQWQPGTVEYSLDRKIQAQLLKSDSDLWQGNVGRGLNPGPQCQWLMMDREKFEWFYLGALWQVRNTA
jgi:hypothetical protein